MQRRQAFTKNARNPSTLLSEHQVGLRAGVGQLHAKMQIPGIPYKL
jgi:hypothetical protein